MNGYRTELFVNRDEEISRFWKLVEPETPQTVMLVEADKFMGKTWLISQLSRSCCEQLSTAPVIAIDFKDEYERHAVQDALSLVRLIQEKLGHPEYFTPLDAVIGQFAVVHRPAGVAALMPVIEKIEETYDLERLERLAMWLDVIWENIAGDTMFQKAKGLVMHFQRSGDLLRLLQRLQHERPNVDWRPLFEPLLGGPGPVSGQGAAETTPSRHTMGISIPAEGRELAEAQINRAFLECLEKLLADVSPIIFLFDGCEEVLDEAERWIRQQLIDPLIRGKLKGLIVILAARKIPYRLDVEEAHVAFKTHLDGFDETRARELFEAHGVRVDSDTLPDLVRCSGGEPGMLARMVDNLRAKSDKGDPFLQ